MESNCEVTRESLDPRQVLEELEASIPEGTLVADGVMTHVGAILLETKEIPTSRKVELLREIATTLTSLVSGPGEYNQDQRETIVGAIELFLEKRTGQPYLSPEDRGIAERIAEEQVPPSNEELEKRKELHRQ